MYVKITYIIYIYMRSTTHMNLSPSFPELLTYIYQIFFFISNCFLAHLLYIYAQIANFCSVFFLLFNFLFLPNYQSIQSIQSLLKNVIYTYIYKRKIFKFLNIKKKETKLFLKDFDQKSNFIEIFQDISILLFIRYNFIPYYDSI